MASIKRREDGQWRARYRDDAGREHARHFARKVDAQRWIDETTASLVQGTHVDPKTAKTTVEKWCATWLQGYQTRRVSTVRQARSHIGQINRAFGSMRLTDVRPSEVKAWTAKLKAEGYADSTVYATYRRFAQIMGDAVHDGIIPRSPCSRRTSPGAGSQRPYVATTEQVWAEVGRCSPQELQRAVRTARSKVDGLPEGFRFHDLRHYFASLLIASGLDVKVVQTRLRHASAMTTLNTYGHLWPDADESSRAAVGVVLAARKDSSRTERVAD